MKAKIYDFNPSFDLPDGEDELSEYVIREADYIRTDGCLMLKCGQNSHTYRLIHDGEIMCEVCRPDIAPQCSRVYQKICPRMPESV